MRLAALYEPDAPHNHYNGATLVTSKYLEGFLAWLTSVIGLLAETFYQLL